MFYNCYIVHHRCIMLSKQNLNNRLLPILYIKILQRIYTKIHDVIYMFFSLPVYKKIPFPLYSKNIYVLYINLSVFVCINLSVFVCINLSVFVYIKLSSLLYIKIVLTHLIHMMGYFILCLCICKVEEPFASLSIVRPTSYNYIEQHNQSYAHLFVHIRIKTTKMDNDTPKTKNALKSKLRACILFFHLFFILNERQ